MVGSGCGVCVSSCNRYLSALLVAIALIHICKIHFPFGVEQGIIKDNALHILSLLDINLAKKLSQSVKYFYEIPNPLQHSPFFY